MTPLLAELAVIAEQAGRIAQAARARFEVEMKDDGSLVTNGDREVETYLRKALPSLIPGTGVWGEEFGHDGIGPNGLWTVDPVDGTTNYRFGSPLWGVAIGLYHTGGIHLAAARLADLDETYVAAPGTGVYLNGKPLPRFEPGPIRPEETVVINESMVRRNGFEFIEAKLRVTGSAVVDGAFTACGRFRALVGVRERLYDIAPSVLFGQELGAVVRYRDGDPLDLEALAQPVQISKPWVVWPRDH